MRFGCDRGRLVARSRREVPYDNVIAAEGPHHGGFHIASGFQQGVDFMLEGRKAR